MKLRVSVGATHVGDLRRTLGGAMRFDADAAWLDAGQQPRLGLGFLGDTRPRIAGTGIPEWFENLIPEPGPLRDRICAEHGLDPEDDAALLVAVGADLPGAVRIEPSREPGSDPPPAETSTNGPSDEPAPAGIRLSALAGVQFKLSALRSGDRFSLPVGPDGSWILKFEGQGFERLSEVEAATMEWARRSGLEVPRFEVVPPSAIDAAGVSLPDSAALFAIERFDRGPGGLRVHQEDFAQALELKPRYKYGGTGKRAISYDGVARLVADAAGPPGLTEFVRRMAFVIGSGNADAHLKNWTFQWPDGVPAPNLSPCYDQVATISWPRLDRELALRFGGERRFDRLDRDALSRFMERAKADESEFTALLECMADRWGEVEERAPASMRAAVRKHWMTVPLLRPFADKLGGA